MLLGVACVGFHVGLYSLPVMMFFLTLLLHDAGGRRSARLGQYGVSSGLCFDGRRAAGQYLRWRCWLPGWRTPSAWADAALFLVWQRLAPSPRRRVSCPLHPHHCDEALQFRGEALQLRDEALQLPGEALWLCGEALHFHGETLQLRGEEREELRAR